MALFNVRVYGILIDDQNRLLVSDEFIRGDYFTKLPGGGLEFGEGTRDCLVREYMEETGIEVSIKSHLYTTDFFQISAFNNTDQIISIYYTVEAISNTELIRTSTKAFDFTEDQISDNTKCAESFRWVSIDAVSEETMSLPIDKVAIRILKEQLG
jgi:ADP-ribose pyrophosphatase YjhB (NUDIX family)